MIDTGFHVPAAKLGRFTEHVRPVRVLGVAREGLELFDAVDGWYTTTPASRRRSGTGVHGR